MTTVKNCEFLLYLSCKLNLNNSHGILSHLFRRLRRVMKSPDPLEEQRRKELQQGELGTSGLFG